jgi:predicted PurR-regulated permease PerM
MLPGDSLSIRAPSSGDGSGPAPGRRRQFPNVLERPLATAARAVFIVMALIAFAYLARPVVLPVLLAWMIAMTLQPLVRWLRSYHVPPFLAAGLVVILVVGSGAVGMVRLAQPAIEWVQSAPEYAPRIKEKFRHVLRPAARLSEAASHVGSLDPGETTAKQPQPVEVKDNRVSSTVFTWTGSLLAGVAETIALVFLLLISGDGVLQKLVRTLSTFREKKQALQISHEIQQQLSKYFFTMASVNCCFGVLMALVFHLIGMPNATMWGGVTALLNFIPYLGPVVGMVAVGLAGLLAFDTVPMGLLPVGSYLILHLVEANAVTPFVLGRRFTLNPVVIFVALIFCIWLWGVPGALLAVPLLVSFKVVCERVPGLAAAGEFLSDG